MSNNIPQTLKDAFANKTLIPLVGAGVSMSLMRKDGERLFPSWRELLERAARKLISENKQNHANAITGALGIDDYQGAADYARKGLSGGLWNKFFKENFSIKREDIEDESLLLPRAIWTLSERIITLNYDRVMRFSCPTSDDVLELDNTTKGELADFKLNNNKSTIWHLHGKIDNLEKIILTSESYSKLYIDNDPDYRAALATFQSLCCTEKLLFIGCSLDDAELLQQIGSQHEIFAENTGPHYALVREADEESIQTKLAGLPIDLISFSDFGQPLLDAISAISATSHEVVLTPRSVKKPEASVCTLANSKNRIAILTANPIGENYDYRASTKELEKLECEITYYPLTIKALNDLEGFDYIFILSRLIKNNLVIEDEALQSARSNFKNIEDNIGNGSTKGIFIFLDNATKDALGSSEILNDIASLQLSVIIFPYLEKSQLDSFRFQYFKKCNIDYISESAIANKDKFQLGELKGSKNIIRTTSKLSESIDKKNSEQYLGRKTDLQYLCREIVELQSVNEFLTIKGPGGTGKTATIKKIAVELSERFIFSEGIDFVDCEFISDYSSFEKKVAASFNLENALNIPLEIRTKLRKQEKLIILDNVETLLHLPDTQQIKDFIYFVCDYASIVLTTREILNLSCEKVIELSRYSSDDAYELFKQYFKREPKDLVEQRTLRQDIVEDLLDNNPLAIKLVASNLPSIKKMSELKQELEEDIFRKASADELNDLDAISDINIERKKSLYASINFSYKSLDDSEKKAFEILSLFPDGIHRNALKAVADGHRDELRNSNKKTRKLQIQVPVITDPIIRNLENKSIIQVDNQIIKLQSIMAKFAERQLNRRKPNELANYYQRASEYHIQFAEYLHSFSFTERSANASNRFNQQQANFFKSIGYICAADISEERMLDYLNTLCALAIGTTLSEKLSIVLKRSESIKSLLQNADASRCFTVLILHLEYYAGRFAEAFSDLQLQVPLDTLLELAPTSLTNKILFRRAIDIYAMEGDVLLELKYIINTKAQLLGYPSTLFQVGEMDSALLTGHKFGVTTLETRHALGVLDFHEIDKHIARAYEKDHLDLMQLHYIKSKLGLKNKRGIDTQSIKNLVIVNPYTRGLQQLMLAFSSDKPTEAIALYEQALSNLIHIKYYYVEALLYYSRYLKQQNMHSEFNKIYQEGYGLACKHHYRWLRYQLEDLIEKKSVSYNSADYPLPEELDINGYIQWLIKQNKES
jgi:hypothetical protein